MAKAHSGFTLIEVMVSVMIVSVVIAALLQMQGNTSTLFHTIKEQGRADGYASFLLWNDKYGFEKEHLNLYHLVDDFDLDDDMRRKLKSQEIELQYKTIKTIDLSEDNTSDAKTVFEIGATSLEYKKLTTSLLRLRLQ